MTLKSFKLMNNSVFGKTMENIRSRSGVVILSGHETKRLEKLIVREVQVQKCVFTYPVNGQFYFALKVSVGCPT